MIDREQRRHWAEERERRGLMQGGGHFASLGLMANLDESRVLVTALPADPLHPAVDLRDQVLFADVLPRAFVGKTANGVSTLAYEGRTAESVVRYSRLGQDQVGWRAFVAVRSDGGVEVGMGGVACWEYPSESPLAGRLAFRLFVLVHAARVAIGTQARLCQRVPGLDPFELIVGIHAPEGALLSAFAPGWEDPPYSFEVTTTLQAHPLIREEIESWPGNPEGQHDLLVKVSGRICSAFNVAEPRFLPWLGHDVGELSEGYA